MYNRVIMIGRLVADPQLIKTPKDKSVCRVSVAVNRRYKNAQGERQVDFVNLVLWGKLAESLVSYGSKGSLISLEGELRTRRYEKDGKNCYVTEVLCHTFQLLESRAQRAMRENNMTNDLSDLVLDEEDDLPF
ncbi:single-stranded DNA-binding protein [Streptococcus parauberis]|uniref:Single-stranded DNA-binding protein n=4 Tax=Streptococcus parauberis TaxID=1348 RepID=F1Z0E1_9STRE|nr:single-stranded DNA-binding protein [Streptococcus parauberis]AEF26024.1 single stranded DNA-binding protein [Streptococcus parauberis KCTC 11537]AUT05158.1 Single-stranded DNA-binding protein [Streptococcus parauberis]EGE54841.1 single-stranded DNA-binding protein [Streptococcus parauberis NCFD 2020]EMF49074.1 Single-stranded DNA-binding protein [Streptococcus parauberis KRS-02109]EMG24626.1 Single-stranded DNA-binding protein [Streptococcus parauberis KRS-02083]